MSFFCNPGSLGLIDRGQGGSTALHTKPGAKQYAATEWWERRHNADYWLTPSSRQLLSGGNLVFSLLLFYQKWTIKRFFRVPLCQILPASLKYYKISVYVKWISESMLYYPLKDNFSLFKAAIALKDPLQALCSISWCRLCPLLFHLSEDIYLIY